MGQDSKIEWTTHTGGNRIARSDGYILVRCPEYPGASRNGYVLEHRLVAAQSLGRPLQAAEHVHHINGDKADNRAENLQLLSNSEHRKLHEAALPLEEKQAKAAHLVAYSKSRALPRRQIGCSCGCGQLVTTPDKKGRPKRFVRGHNQTNRTWRWNRGTNNN